MIWSENMILSLGWFVES